MFRQHALMYMLMLQAPMFATAAEPCATDQVHLDLLETNPRYKRELDQLQTQARHSMGSNKSIPVVTVPVVVHVMHRGSALGSEENISDEQIQSAIVA